MSFILARGVEGAAVPEDDDDVVISPQDAHLILADDSSVIRASLLKILHHYGYEDVKVCTDGQQAWDILQETRDSGGRQFDLVLTDIEMPRMDGLHLTSRIKSDPQLKDIPVVLFSSLINSDNIRKGESVGADAQVSKPDSDEMIKAIEDCLSRKCVTA